ncbi:hypothetical protein ACIBW9_16780 [Streptomyces sp. NPDC049541]
MVVSETVKRTGSVDVAGYYAAATCALSALVLGKAPERKAG